MPFDLDRELDRLYGADLADFVAERARLARALRDEGRRAEAASVQELRKPSLVVWAVNQLTRRRRKDVDLLLDAGHRLAAAQVALLSGGDSRSFQEARRREQAVLKRLRQGAGMILGGRASAGTLDRIVATLRAGAVSEEGRETLARGRLVDEIAATGFEVYAGIVPAPAQIRKRPAPAATEPPPEPAKRQDRAEKAEARRKAIAGAQADLKAARERQAELVKQLRQSERAVKQARKELDSVERGLERLQADREAAERAVEAARSELETARAADS